MTSSAKSAYTAIHRPRAGGTRSGELATRAGEESRQDPTQRHLPPTSAALRPCPESGPWSPAPRSGDHAAANGFRDPPDTEEGRQRPKETRFLGAQASEDLPWCSSLPFLSRTRGNVVPSQDRIGARQTRSSSNPQPLPQPRPPPWRPAPGVPRRVLAADEVCAQGTQEFPAPCKGQRSDGAEMSTLRWSKDNRHRWLQGNRARVRALRGMKTQARAAGKGGLRLGQARLRGPSRCRASAQKRSRGPPRGWFRRLLQQPPQAPGRRRAHLMRGGRPCRGRGSASGKESVVPGPTRPER